MDNFSWFIGYYVRPIKKDGSNAKVRAVTEYIRLLLASRNLYCHGGDLNPNMCCSP